MKTKLFKNEIDEAAEIIKQGGLVAIPTETVYGLACNGLDTSAVDRVYEVKGRPSVKPLSLMVPDISHIEKYCEDVPKAAYTLAENFWPGALTIVMKSKKNVPELVRAGGATVGLRCPDHPVTLALLKQVELPLAVPSANPSGEPSSKNAETVLRYFDGMIEAVIDGGECGIGTESTIIDLSTLPYSILREGALSAETVLCELARHMTVIGIAGGSGGGKTTALLTLKDLGALVIDCDEVYHELLSDSKEMLSELEDRFSSCFISGTLDRKELGRTVFADSEKLQILNKITHKYVCKEVDKMLADWAAQGGSLVAIDAIALIEAGIGSRCTAVLGITAPLEQRIQRLIAREDISEEYARFRVAAQKPDEFFEKNCDYTICNDGSTDEFIEKCRKLFSGII